MQKTAKLKLHFYFLDEWTDLCASKAIFSDIKNKYNLNSNMLPDSCESYAKIWKRVYPITRYSFKSFKF